MGTDVSVTHEVEFGKTHDVAIAQLKESFRQSCTPLVELDGHKIDISNFLINEIHRLEVDCNRLRSMITALQREILQRQPKVIICDECGLNVDDSGCCQNDQDLWK